MTNLSTEFLIYRRGKKSRQLKVLERCRTKAEAQQAVKEWRAIDNNYTYRIREEAMGRYGHDNE